MSIKQIPNIITIIRLAATLFVVLLLAFVTNKNSERDVTLCVLSALVFGVAMLSDMVDGYMARKCKCSSAFGKLVDPLADKMLFLSALIMLIPLGRVSAWIVVVLFAREVMVTTLRGLAAERGIIIQADHWGKYKASFLSAALFGIILHYPFFGIDWRMTGWALMWPGVALSVFSGVHYAVGYFRQYGLK